MLSLTDSIYCLYDILGRLLHATCRLQLFVSIFGCDDGARQRKQQVHGRNMPQIGTKGSRFSCSLTWQIQQDSRIKVFLSVTFVCSFVLIDPCSLLHSAMHWRGCGSCACSCPSCHPSYHSFRNYPTLNVKCTLCLPSEDL